MRIFLSEGLVGSMPREYIGTLLSASSLRKRQSNPRLNPSNSRREIQLQSWPSCVILRRARHTFFHTFFTHGKLEKTGGEYEYRERKKTKTIKEVYQADGRRCGRVCAPSDSHHTRRPPGGEAHTQPGIEAASRESRRSC